MPIFKNKIKNLAGRPFLFLAIGLIAMTSVPPTTKIEAGIAPLKTNTPESFSQLVKKVKPAVVYISTIKIIKDGREFRHPFGGHANPNDPFGEFFERFFGGGPQRDYRQKGLGSGFIIDAQGYVLTNNHVVEQSDEITVTLANEKSYPAEIVGRDPKTDLALIKIKAEETLEPLGLGDSDTLEVGDWVVAMGNPYGLGNTVTAGIVSYKSRNIGAGPYDDFIQTDAAINPGNSGGPLLNTSGDVIGINTAIFSRSGGNIGIGFAIPINMAKDLLPQLRQGHVVRGWLGVMIQKITPELKQALKLKNEQGALVSDITPDSPAHKAGIQRSDVIISFDGKEIKEMKELPYIVGTTPVGKKVEVVILRDGRPKTVKIKVGELKDTGPLEKAAEPETKLGMTVEALTPQLARELGLTQKQGVLVTQVQRDSAAADAGFQPGDVILKMDETEIIKLSNYYKKLENVKDGKLVLFLVKRSKSTLYLTMKIEK